MAKFNIEVELDWINDDTVDSSIKHAIVSKVVETVVAKVISEVKQEVSGVIVEKLTTKVDATYEELMSQPIVVTDRWGEEKEAFSSLESAIKKRVDHYFTEQVDSSGKASQYGNKVGTRLQWLIDNRVTKETDKKIKEAIKEVDDKIKDTLDTKFKEHISNKLTDFVEFDQFLKTKQLK